MIYPVIVVLAAIGVVSFLLGVIIPKFAAFLNKRGKQLPEPTQLLIDMSNFAVNYGGYIFGFFVILAVVIGAYYSTPRGRLVIDKLLLRMPVIGKLLTNSAMADFSWSLSMMLRSGLTAFEGLQIASKVIGNRYISNHLAEAAEKSELAKIWLAVLKVKVSPI